MKTAALLLLTLHLLASTALAAEPPATVFEEDALASASIAAAMVEVTATALSPLLVFAALGAKRYIDADGDLSGAPWHAHPAVWGVLLVLVLAVMFKETLVRVPLLKKPLDAGELVLNKAAAVLATPAILAIGADAAGLNLGRLAAGISSWLIPTAYAASPDAAAGSAALELFSGIVGATAALVVFVVVWLASNAVNVLMLLCPFAIIDNALRLARLGFLLFLGGLALLSPTAALVFCTLLFLFTLAISGWSFRLFVFGLVFTKDFLLHVRDADVGVDIHAFAVRRCHGIPLRTYGTLRLGPGGVEFAYRPLSGVRERVLSLGGLELGVGSGLLSPVVSARVPEFTPFFRLPPRYRGAEAAVAEALGNLPTYDASIAGSARRWLSSAVARMKAAREPVIAGTAIE